MTADLVRFRRAAAAVALTASATLSGCRLGGDTALPPFTNPATATYAASTGVVIASMTRVNESVYYQDVVAKDTGRVVAVGDSLRLYYKGSLSSGSVFGTVARPDSAVNLVLDSTLIRGWVSGLPGMRTGGTRRLVIGPASGYGYNARTDASQTVIIIPSNSVLVFDVEVLRSVPKP